MGIASTFFHDFSLQKWLRLEGTPGGHTIQNPEFIIFLQSQQPILSAFQGEIQLVQQISMHPVVINSL